MAESYDKGSSSYDRALGFFDAVYGFALTLLVTTIDVSGGATWQSVGSLLGTNASQLASFAVSFVVIAVFWRQNHHLLERFDRIDGVTIWSNIAVMLFVVFIPFTTEAIGDPALRHLPLPTALYALNVAGAILASIAMYQIALRRGMVRSTLSRRGRRAQLLSALTRPAVFVLSVPVTYLAVEAWDTSTPGQLFWLLLLVTGPIAGRWAARAAVPAGPAAIGG
ncbi:TMEM175 family protein [Pseudactinotalea sp. HY158]|uniref:TMEM175 family protein n=1 Tax=Pseudactinotalea sp. HY158 TaxID=2654547 RepID=UPI00129D20C7|nr:TMEM175 family protein [Pseudactinotalea sp. HY158]QGH68383.1 DUF1211 domain-containing protein [Pseudactinotalea sp. HY158]